jgi:hypothetical protein
MYDTIASLSKQQERLITDGQVIPGVFQRNIGNRSYLFDSGLS